MDHCYRTTCGGHNHVNFFIDPVERTFQYNHRENGRPSRYVARARSDGVCGNHTRSGVSLTWDECRSCVKNAINQFRTTRCKLSGRRSCRKHIGKNITHIELKALFGSKIIEFLHHYGIIIHSAAVNREHTGRFADANSIHTCEHMVHIASQRRNMCDTSGMLLAVKQCLIKKSDTPPLRNIEVKSRCQLLRRLRSDGVLPCTERYQQISVPVKRNVSVHHAGNANRIKVFAAERCKGGFQTFPHLVDRICPYSIDILALPCITAFTYEGKSFVYLDGLYAGRAQFYAEKMSFSHGSFLRGQFKNDLAVGTTSLVRTVRILREEHGEAPGTEIDRSVSRVKTGKGDVAL